MTASGSLRLQWGWLPLWCRRVLTRAADGGRRHSFYGFCWRPLRVGKAAPASTRAVQSSALGEPNSSGSGKALSSEGAHQVTRHG